MLFELGGFNVNANSSGHGLQVQWSPLLQTPVSRNMNVGDSVTVDLFRIWTDETSVNSGEDTQPNPISVDFDFTSPSFGGTASGSTSGGTVHFGFIPVHFGRVTWSGPSNLTFGQNNDGVLQVSLSNEHFNTGIFGLRPSQRHGATVQATFSLLQEPGVVLNPEPASLLVWSLLSAAGFAITVYGRPKQYG